MSTEHTILGVISFTPCSGYDMKVEFEKTLYGQVLKAEEEKPDEMDERARDKMDP